MYTFKKSKVSCACIACVLKKKKSNIQAINDAVTQSRCACKYCVQVRRELAIYREYGAGSKMRVTSLNGKGNLTQSEIQETIHECDAAMCKRYFDADFMMHTHIAVGAQEKMICGFCARILGL